MTNTALSPGSYLQLQIDAFSLTPNNMCGALKCSMTYLDMLLDNNAPITAEIARELSMLTYTKSDYWLKIQSE